jgi:hypothetical protein
MKKILCFDSWTRGSHHFIRLKNEFNENGFTLILVHFGSWGHDVDRPKEEYINGMLVRDISYYGNICIKKLLKLEKPDVVLFLSVRSFIHQSIIRYCKFLKINTVHLYHGITQDEIEDTKLKKHKTIPISVIKSKAVKNIFKTIPVYIKSIYETNSNFKDYLIVFSEIINKVNSNYFKKAPSDCVTDLGFVYLPYEISHMNYYYGVPLNKIFSFGNPDLIDFNFKNELLGIGLKETRKIKNEIIYFDAGYLRIGLYYLDNFDFLRHIMEIKRQLEDQGLKLKLKLHPSSSEEFIKLLIDNDIEVIYKDDLINTLYSCVGVISEPSTLSLLPAIMGLPIFLLKYGKLENVSYNNVITSYPRAKTLLNFKSFNFGFNNEKFHFDSWIENFIVNTDPTKISNKIVNKILNELCTD